MLDESAMQKYVTEAFAEQLLRAAEDNVLKIMKQRYEAIPTEKNDQEWLDYSNFVCRRRCIHERDK